MYPQNGLNHLECLTFQKLRHPNKCHLLITFKKQALLFFYKMLKYKIKNKSTDTKFVFIDVIQKVMLKFVCSFVGMLIISNSTKLMVNVCSCCDTPNALMFQILQYIETI